MGKKKSEVYPKGYFEQLRQADMLMAEISREKPKQDNLLREKAMIESALRQRACGKRYTLLKALDEINNKKGGTMKKEIFTCDKCGKEVENTDYDELPMALSLEIRIYRNYMDGVYEIKTHEDLCNDCYEKLKEHISAFFKKGK